MKGVLASALKNWEKQLRAKAHVVKMPVFTPP